MRSPYCDATPHTQPERKRTCVNDGNRIARVAVARARVHEGTRGVGAARVPVKRHRGEPDTRVHGRNHQKTAEGSCRQDAQPPIRRCGCVGGLGWSWRLACWVATCEVFACVIRVPVVPVNPVCPVCPVCVPAPPGVFLPPGVTTGKRCLFTSGKKTPGGAGTHTGHADALFTGPAETHRHISSLFHSVFRHLVSRKCGRQSQLSAASCSPA